MPAFFRSEFLEGNSLLQSEVRIDEYNATVGAARDYVAMSVSNPSKGQAGCSLDKLAEALHHGGPFDNPPFRLLLGRAALRRVAEKHANVDADVESWRAVSEMVDS